MHATGAITPYIDVAQLVLYAFWIFFGGLVVYLTLESKREGFPLITSRPGERLDGILPMPSPKKLRLRDGTVRLVPSLEPEEIVNAAQAQKFEGAPWVPLGDPMQDGVGPAAYALRSTEPEKTFEGTDRTVPMRADPAYWVAPEDHDPRGWEVVCADGVTAYDVRDFWVDRAENQARYIEVALPDAPDSRGIVVPMELVVVKKRARGGAVKISSVTGAQLAAAPIPESPTSITAREEDRIQAYFASGELYALPGRMGPLL
jgi:photosynthetic reaction center H subunit